MRVIEFGGGLGDVFTDIFSSNMYTQLDVLHRLERAQIVLRSANPYIGELFKWHPKASQLDVVEVGGGDPWGPEQRGKFCVGEPSPKLPRDKALVNFYPSPEDRRLLDSIKKPYIVFAISAGAPSVNIPINIAEQAADIATDKNLEVVTVGRSYANILKNFNDGSQGILPREEFRLNPRAGVTDTIDKLSVPGLALLVESAAATFCCHSSLLSIAWQFRRPTFCAYHEMKKREWVEKAGTTWGRDFKETVSVCLDDWSPEIFEKFIDEIVVRRRLEVPKFFADYNMGSKQAGKTVSVDLQVGDLNWLAEELRRASFLVRNVGRDSKRTYVYLDSAEDKDPRQIIESLAMRAGHAQGQVANKFTDVEKRFGYSRGLSFSGSHEVDLLVPNWNTLPWLMLLKSQLERVNTRASFKLHVWDDMSNDGSVEWLGKSSISFRACQGKAGHAGGLKKLIDTTSAPYIALLDVDAMPIKEGWLDEALISVRDNGFSVAGLNGGIAAGKPFIHFSFCVFSRKLFVDLGLSLDVVFSDGTLFDVGQFMCIKLQSAGHKLKMTGDAHCYPWDEGFSNRVFHFWGSTNILAYEGRNEGVGRDSANGQIKLLKHFGLLDEFRSYAIEVARTNPRCNLYLPL